MPKKPSTSGGMSRSSTMSSNTSISSASTLGRKPQIVNGRYLDKQKLRDYLDKRWGPGKYALDLTRDKWTITGPEDLSDDVLEKLEA